MDTLTRPISLAEIRYPVFYLSTYKPEFAEGVTFFLYSNEDKGVTYKVVDDKSVPGDSLARRRLHMLDNGVPLKKLSKAVFMLSDLVKIARPINWYIDSNGVVFRYVKSIGYKLISHKIKKIIPIPTGGAIVEVENIPTRFKVVFNPDPEVKYASILQKGMSFILYGLTKDLQSNTRRKI